MVLFGHSADETTVSVASFAQAAAGLGLKLLLCNSLHLIWVNFHKSEYSRSCDQGM